MPGPSPIEFRHKTLASAKTEVQPLIIDISEEGNEIFQNARSERVYRECPDLSKVKVSSLNQLQSEATTRESSRGKFALLCLLASITLVATAIIGSHYGIHPLEVASGLGAGFFAILFCVFLGLKLLARHDKKKLEKELQRVEDLRQLGHIANRFRTEVVQLNHLIRIRDICQKWNLDDGQLLNNVNEAIRLFPSELLKK